MATKQKPINKQQTTAKMVKPKVTPQQSKATPQQSKADPKLPKANPQQPKKDPQQPKANPQQPKEDTQQSKASQPQLNAKSQQSNEEEEVIKEANIRIKELDEAMEGMIAQKVPEEFQGAALLQSIGSMTSVLQSNNFQELDQTFSATEFNEELTRLLEHMTHFQSYSRHTQSEMEKLQKLMENMKDRIYIKLGVTPGYGTYESIRGDFSSLEQRLLEVSNQLIAATVISIKARKEGAKVSQLADILVKEVIRIREDIIAQQQKDIEEELEHRKRQEEEERELLEKEEEEKRRQLEKEEGREVGDNKEAEAHESAGETKNGGREEDEPLGESEENEKLNEEEKIAAERLAESKRQEEDGELKTEEQKAEEEEWTKWPHYVYEITGGDFDHGIGCVVRGHPKWFTKDLLECKLVHRHDGSFLCKDTEELASNIILLSTTGGSDELKGPIRVSIPYIMSRSSANVREPVIIMETDKGLWTAQTSQEEKFEEYRDIQFVHADVIPNKPLAVVTRLKRDFLYLSKGGGTAQSTVDSRLSFTARRGVFHNREEFVVQIQPVDASIVGDLRAEHRGLVTVSSLVRIEWESASFHSPITIVMHCPPNPAKAKKAAEARAAREAQKKKQQQQTTTFETDERGRKIEKKKSLMQIMIDHKREEEEEEGETVAARKPTKWFMGEYGLADDDDQDVLCCVRRWTSGRWTVIEDAEPAELPNDHVQITLSEPVDVIVIMKLRSVAEEQNIQVYMENLEKKLKYKNVVSLMAQKFDNPSEHKLELVLENRVDKAVRKLEEGGYLVDQHQRNAPLLLREGDRLQLCLRGNIQMNVDGSETGELPMEDQLSRVFHSQLTTSIQFSVTERDRFLQKNSDFYQGIAQLDRVVKIVAGQPPRKSVQSEKSVKITFDSGESAAKGVKVTGDHKLEKLCEHMIKLPKIQGAGEKTKFLQTVKFTFTDEFLPDEILRELAAEIGDEWEKVAHYLKVDRPRRQAILRNNLDVDYSNEESNYDMLLAWVKRTSKGATKIDILISALSKSGRHDLANGLISRKRRQLERAEMNGTVENKRIVEESGQEENLREVEIAA